MNLDDAFAKLDALGKSHIGAASWSPPDELVDKLIGARQRGAGAKAIAAALNELGYGVGESTVREWFRRIGKWDLPTTTR